MSFETQENQTFWRDIPGFCQDIPGVPEKFEKKRFVFIFRPLETGTIWQIGVLTAERDGPNTVSESTVSNTELSEFF